ncbi:hypothetical protein Ddye_010710 [Dipteronia dyeriana]|uniref:Uncharacterized protein n=1 Tax=Dipteronia dyeriana TaxID=168575 RepID=A0AAE0CP31_9ROSI|nr:hypothetical protein Ddye_010710 [Dipteronia dyeriana]
MKYVFVGVSLCVLVLVFKSMCFFFFGPYCCLLWPVCLCKKVSFLRQRNEFIWVIQILIGFGLLINPRLVRLYKIERDVNQGPVDMLFSVKAEKKGQREFEKVKKKKRGKCP